jgi:hypothetical protein
MKHHTPRYSTPMRHARRDVDHSKAIAGAVILALVVAGIIGAVIFQNTTKTTQECHVTGKDMVHQPAVPATKTSSGEAAKNIYQVYTKDCGTLRVEDNAFQGVWNSADLYGALVPEKSYRITTVGIRMPFFSIFPTIVKVEPAR